MIVNKRFVSIILSISSMLFAYGNLSTKVVYAEDNSVVTERLSGSDRFETSVNISKAGWGQANTVIIVSGLDYPDALAASALSKSKDAPILLTKKTALDATTLAEVQRLKATQAFLIGGTGVIGTGVETQLKGLKIATTRVSGTDRYDTARKVAQIVGVGNGIILASSSGFPDSLSIAPISSIKSMPILLSPQNAVGDSTTTFIKQGNIPVSYIVGGTGALSDKVVASVPNGKRLSGNDRYATNLSINSEFAANLNFDTVYIASGNDFPDALGGAALAAKNNAPIILTDKNSISKATMDFILAKNVAHVVILGGIGAISKNVETTVNTTISSAAVHPVSISLSKSTDLLTVGTFETLTSSIVPTNATNKEITWTSSNEAVAKVDKAGVVTAVSTGSAIITITTADGSKSATCNVSVTEPIVKVETLSLSSTADTLALNSTETLVATVSPDNATNKSVIWASSNNSVATVDNTGKVTAIGLGTTFITASTVDGGKSAVCGITVSGSVISATGLTLNKTVDSLTVKSTDTLTATITPNNTTNKGLIWSSSNKAVATVDNTGKVTAISKGTAFITVSTSDGGKSTICSVTIVDTPVGPTPLSLNKKVDSLTVSCSETLKATATYDDGTNKALTWASSNNSVATVDNTGKVTAITAGSAIITVITADGKESLTCNLTVFNPGPGHMLVTDSLVNFTASYEGYRANPYVGVDSQNYTIGYGHVILTGENYTNLTQPQALDLLKQDLQGSFNGVNSFTSDMNLSQQQFDALVDFAYNCGVNGLQGSTLFKDIKAGASNDKLKTDFLLWVNSNGTPYINLYQRRTDEWEMYTTGNYTRDYTQAPSGYK